MNAKRRRRQLGFTLLETVMTLVIFGMFIFILVTLTAEMRGYEKRYPVNFMKHPQVTAVLSRLRRDVWDAWGQNIYPTVAPDPPEAARYTQTPRTLILKTVQETGFVQTVVWDFTTPGEARRISYNVGVATEWVARGLPATFTVTTYEIPSRPFAVRVQASDATGALAIDQIFQPRAH